jgi:hypothetical protein
MMADSKILPAWERELLKMIDWDERMKLRIINVRAFDSTSPCEVQGVLTLCVKGSLTGGLM